MGFKVVLIVFLLIPLFFVVIIFFSVKIIKKRYGTVKKYYLGIKRPSYKKKKNIEKIFDVINIPIVFGVAIVILLLILSASLILIILKEQGRIKKEYVEYIFVLHQSLTFDKIGVIGIIVAIATVLVAFRKEYYLVFSIEDVLERFQFKEKIQSIIYAVIGSGIFAIFE